MFYLEWFEVKLGLFTSVNRDGTWNYNGADQKYWTLASVIQSSDTIFKASGWSVQVYFQETPIFIFFCSFFLIQYFLESD